VRLGGAARVSPLLTAYYDTGSSTSPACGSFSTAASWILGPQKTWVRGNRAAAEALVGIKTVMAWNPEERQPGEHRLRAGFHRPGSMEGRRRWPSGGGAGWHGSVKALESCATNLSGPALRDAILAVDMEGPEGRVFFAPGDQRRHQAMVL